MKIITSLTTIITSLFIVETSYAQTDKLDTIPSIICQTSENAQKHLTYIIDIIVDYKSKPVEFIQFSKLKPIHGIEMDILICNERLFDDDNLTSGEPQNLDTIGNGSCISTSGSGWTRPHAVFSRFSLPAEFTNKQTVNMSINNYFPESTPLGGDQKETGKSIPKPITDDHTWTEYISVLNCTPDYILRDKMLTKY